MEHGLEYKPANVWDTFADPEKKLEISSFAADYISFLSQCKTEREVAAWIEKQLLEYGFTPAEDGPITEQRTFRVIGNKTVLAFFGGRRTLSDGVRLIAAHGDSPRLDLKQRPLFEEHNVAMFRTHYYGGIRKHQWLSIPLALHGVVIKKDGTRVDIAIGESPDEPVLTIADLLPHLAYKQVEQRLSEAFEAEKLCVIVGHAPEDRKKSDSDSDEEKKPKDNARIKCAVLKILNERFGIDETDLISAELQAVPAGPARFVGLDESLIGGYGQDDRACVFTALDRKSVV